MPVAVSTSCATGETWCSELTGRSSDQTKRASGSSNRELAVKKRARARLTGERPDPVAVARPYDFRAGVARSIVADIKNARP